MAFSASMTGYRHALPALWQQPVTYEPNQEIPYLPQPALAPQGGALVPPAPTQTENTFEFIQDLAPIAAAGLAGGPAGLLIALAAGTAAQTFRGQKQRERDRELALRAAQADAEAARLPEAKVVGKSAVDLNPLSPTYGQPIYEEPPSAEPRRIVKGADGRNYYEDTQEPVLPGVEAPEEETDLFEVESKLRAEFQKQPAVKNFAGAEAAMGRIIASSQDPSPAGDMSLIFAYMKLLDPNSTVREGEYAQAEQTGSIPDNIVTAYNKALSGEKLTDERRRDFVDRAGKLYEQSASAYDTARKQYKGLAEQYEVDPARVGLLERGYTPEDWALQSPPPPPGAVLD